MKELKTLTLGEEKFDSFPDQTARERCKSIPTKTSQISNDSGFLTEHQSLEGYAKTKDLSEVAKSGNYSDLSNRPTIPTVPTKVSAFTNDAGYLTKHQDISGKLDANKLSEAIDDALAKAKASGAFDGKDGVTPELSIGTVETLAAGSKAEVSMGGTKEKPVLKFGIPQGAQGIPGVAQTPLFADSVEECADTSKVYVLPDGFIYAYRYVEKVIAGVSNLFDPSAAKYNYRINSSFSEVAYDGSLLLPPIEIKMQSPYTVNISGVTLANNYGMRVAVYYRSDGSILGETHASGLNSAASGLYVSQNADGSYTFDLYNDKYLNADSVILKLGITSGTPITTDDTANLVVEFVPKNTSATVGGYQWANTGHAFVPTEYDEYIAEMTNRISQHDAALANHEQRINDLESGSASVPVDTGYPSVWDDSVAQCIARIKTLQVGRDCVTFPFFSDNHQRLGYAGALIAKIMDECHIPYCFYGGDSISSGYIASENVMIAQDKAFDSMMKAIPNGRFCRTVGNHDGFWNVSAETGDENQYSREQVYELFLREESVAQNKHFGGDGTYYYVEDIAGKVRFVVLNSNGGSFDSAQIDWLQNTALKFAENGWGVVFFSHAPITNNFHSNISNAQTVQGIITDFINAGTAEVIGWFSGHIHRDRIYWRDHTGNTEADDQTTKTLAWPTVTITSDHTGISYDDATLHTVGEDDQSHAIDFVTVNKATRTVSLTRLGIGNDRSYTY